MPIYIYTYMCFFFLYYKVYVRINMYKNKWAGGRRGWRGYCGKFICIKLACIETKRPGAAVSSVRNVEIAALIFPLTKYRGDRVAEFDDTPPSRLAANKGNSPSDLRLFNARGLRETEIL